MDVQFLPLTDPAIPDTEWLSIEPPVGCVAAVEVTGTDRQRMAERGGFIVEHALRVLRIALRAHMGINDRQLRFRRGTSWAFNDGAAGWQRPPESAYELELNDELLDLATAQEVSSVGPEPSTKLEHQVDVALRWLERARFEPQPMTALLFMFFALEALLGEVSEGRKAHMLAFRQALLGLASGQGFAHPDDTYRLYDKVRSIAVHGEDLPEVDEERAQHFALTVWRTLDLYLNFAKGKNYTRRSQLIDALLALPARAQLVAWLRANGAAEWKWEPYLEKVERAAKVLA